MGSEPIIQLACTECGQPVLLTEAKADERGRPVHEDCYSHRFQAELAERAKAS